METTDGREDDSLCIQTPTELFDGFIQANDLPETLSIFRTLCSSLDINPKNYKTLYTSLKNGLTSWKARSLWSKLDKRADHKDYKGKPCTKNKVLVIGAGPCGLRVAIESALLGAQVVVVEKRDRFSRNNVLHLWPFLITDLKDLGAKKFFGQFCAGSLDHISIKRLQLILLKVSLIFGVQVHTKCAFGKLIEPKNGHGWKATFDPPSSPLNKYEFDIIVGADGRRQALKFKGKEFRGKLAIGITANFVNRNSKEEAQVEEISGVAFIFNQGFFQELKDMTGIDLENIVYYKDETHYFVMCAKKRSLLEKGVIKKDCPDAYDLLHHKNVNHEKLLTYAREAAAFSTKFKMPHMDFAINHQGKEDVAMFDFTSLFAAEYSIKVYERKAKRLLALIVGDSLLEPFWPTGSGCARGFLGCFDAAWAMRSFGLGRRPLEIIAERENVYRLLAQTTPENLNKNYQSYGISPSSRYTNLPKNAVKAATVRHLYDCHEGPIDSVDGAEAMDTSAIIEPPQPEVNISIVLKWCQQHTKGYKNVDINDMSSSWKDGLGLCAIIHRFRPDLIDFDSLDPSNAEKNNQLAFQIAEDNLGIQPQVSAKEIASATVPDQLTILSYITQYYETFKNEIPVSKSISKQDSETKKEFRTKSPLSKLSIITRMTRKKEKRKNVSNTATVASKKSKQTNEENTPPVTPKTPTPTSTDTPIFPEPSETNNTVAKAKLAAKTSNRISILAEQVFGAKEGATIAPTLPKETGSDHCYFCNRFVYLMERMSAEGHFFHRECFKCEVCLNTLRLGAYFYLPPWETDDERGHFYCRLHYYKVINNLPIEGTKKRREEKTETHSQKRKRRGKALTISDPRDTIKAVHQAAALTKKNQSKDKEKSETATNPTTNGVLKVDSNENVTKDHVGKNKDDDKKKLDRNRSSSGRFRRLEARPVRRSSISSVRKSDKTVRTKGRGYKLDDDMLEPEKHSPIKVPPPSPRSSVDMETENKETFPANEKKSKKKLEKSKSAEEAIKGSKDPSGDDKPTGKKRPTLDKLHMLGTIERRRRQRRAMYPPLSHVFSTEDQSIMPENINKEIPIDTPLADIGMNVKVVDIDIEDDGPKNTNSLPTESTPQVTNSNPASKSDNKPPSPTAVTKPPLTKKSSTGSLVSARAARIRGLMDNDLRPKKDYSRPTEVHPDQENGQEIPSQERRSLPQLPSNEEPYTSSIESTKIIKRRATPKPKANIHAIEREVDSNEGNSDQMAKEMGFVMVGFKDVPSTNREGPPKPPRSFKENENPQDLFSGSSEEDMLETPGSSFQRIGARRYKSKGKVDLEEDRKKRSEQAKIRIAMKQRQAKRLRRAQQIQRELQEVEVKQAEIEKDGVHVEKALRSGELSQHEEQQYMMQWFQIINKKNALLRYESELSIHANSIQLEDQQGRLEQEIRELLMKEGSSTEEEQVTIQQKTKELVDIVEQRNCLVELLDEDRKREQEEDRAFEEMIAAKGFVTSV